ncbi:MAG: ABC transporter permease, partial [bacterium]|nr:ABC transporter permease [bacterium]
MTRFSRKTPFIASLMLKWMLNRSIRYGGIGDFQEKYLSVRIDRGRITAWTWYWSQVLQMMPSFMIDSIQRNITLLVNYLKISWRNIHKHKGYSFINIFGLAVGMACTTLILMWVENELGYDKFHDDHENIYRIIQQYENPMQVRKVPCIPGKVATQFKDDFPEILELTFYVEEKG